MSWRDLMPVHPAADLFPMLDDAELVALGNDIKANGLASPIIVDSEDIGKKPVLIDGRNRLAALERVGVCLRLQEPTPRPWRRGAPVYRHYTLIAEPKIYCGVHASGILLSDMSFDDPVAYIASANLHRRHLDAETKRKLVAKLLQEKPDRSDRATAELAKVDHKTVGSVRREMEARGDVPHVAKRVDSKGRHQPARKRAATKSEMEEHHRRERAEECELWLAEHPGRTSAEYTKLLNDPKLLDNELGNWRRAKARAYDDEMRRDWLIEHPGDPLPEHLCALDNPYPDYVEWCAEAKRWIENYKPKVPSEERAPIIADSAEVARLKADNARLNADLTAARAEIERLKAEQSRQSDQLRYDYEMRAFRLEGEYIGRLHKQAEELTRPQISDDVQTEVTRWLELLLPELHKERSKARRAVLKRKRVLTGAAFKKLQLTVASDSGPHRTMKERDEAMRILIALKPYVLDEADEPTKWDDSDLPTDLAGWAKRLQDAELKRRTRDIPNFDGRRLPMPPLLDPRQGKVRVKEKS